jgi:hypothetical protein
MHSGTQQAEVRVQIPCEIEPELFESPLGVAPDEFRLRRSFRMPTGLDESQSVTLELAKFEGAVRVVLNRESDVAVERDILESEDSVSIEVGPSLLQLNMLEVEFRLLPAVAGEVQLVIEEVA